MSIEDVAIVSLVQSSMQWTYSVSHRRLGPDPTVVDLRYASVLSGSVLERTHSAGKQLGPDIP